MTTWPERLSLDTGTTANANRSSGERNAADFKLSGQTGGHSKDMLNGTYSSMKPNVQQNCWDGEIPEIPLANTPP